MNGSKENLLEMHHITKRFAKIVANDDVSLEIRKGEIHAREKKSQYIPQLRP